MLLAGADLHLFYGSQYWESLDLAFSSPSILLLLGKHFNAHEIVQELHSLG